MTIMCHTVGMGKKFGDVKTERINLRITKAEAKIVRLISRKLRSSLSGAVRHLIRLYQGVE